MMTRNNIVLDTGVIQRLAYDNPDEDKDYLETLIVLRELGYNIAIADIAALELGKMINVPTTTKGFDLGRMVDLMEKFISPTVPFWPGRTEATGPKWDLRPMENKEWQAIIQKQWAAFTLGLRERNFKPRKMFLNDEEIEIGSMMHKADEMKEVERRMWLETCEGMKPFANQPLETKVVVMQDATREKFPHIPNADARLDLYIHKAIWLTHQIANGLIKTDSRGSKNDHLDNHLDWCHFNPCIVVTTDTKYLYRCKMAGGYQCHNVRTPEELSKELEETGVIKLIVPGEAP